MVSLIYQGVTAEMSTLVVFAFITALHVVSGWDIVMYPSGAAQYTGEELALTCHVQGTRHELEFVEITWLWQHNGMLLESNRMRTSTHNARNRKAFLSINDIQPSDAGEYACEATLNNGDIQRNSLSLIVLTGWSLSMISLDTRMYPGKDNFHLMCAVRGNVRELRAMETQWVWQHNGVLLESNRSSIWYPREQPPITQTNLAIWDIRKSDSGNYTCEAILSNGVILRKSKHVSVPSGWNMTLTYRPQGYIGMRIVFICTVEKYPGVQVREFRWFHNSVLMESAMTSTNPDWPPRYDYGRRPNVEHMLTGDIQPSDAGEFTCEAILSNGDVLKKATHFLVLSTWNISLTPDQACKSCMTRHTGGEIMFNCTVQNVGWNDPIDLRALEFQWLHNGVLVVPDNSSERSYIYKYESTEAYLFVKNIHQSDAGEYTCDVIHPEIPRKSSFLVVVNDPDIKFIDTPAVQYFSRKSEAHVHCHVQGNPEAVITWLHKDQILRSGKRYSFTSNGLIIHTIRRKNIGVYICKVKIPFHNMPAYQEIMVFVKRPPIEIGYERIYGATGDLIIHCQAEGRPPPTYDWLKEDGDRQIALDDADKYTLDSITGNLLIRNLTKRDEGTYKCTATNDAGAAHKTVVVERIVESPNIRTHEQVVVTVNSTEQQVKQQNANGADDPDHGLLRLGATRIIISTVLLFWVLDS